MKDLVDAVEDINLFLINLFFWTTLKILDSGNMYSI